MHERERHNIILRAVQERPVATVAEIVEWTGASEATVRRDVAALHLEGRLRRVRGGAEALHPSQFGTLAGRPYAVAAAERAAEKRAIADRAVAMCADGDTIIVNGGTTTAQMAHGLMGRRLTVLTNAFPLAEALVKGSQNVVQLTGGTVYREKQMVLSPFEEDGSATFCASRMFMGAQGVGPLGVMEIDPLVIRAEQKLIRQAEELVVLVTSDKLRRRCSLICCPLASVGRLVTDPGIRDEERAMLEDAGVAVEVVAPREEARTA